MKREAITHTKMKRLCRRLNLATWQGVGLLESIFHLTAREAPRGDIGKLSDEDIALAIDYREDPEVMTSTLADSGWFDRHPQHRLVVHGWSEHCEDGVHMRLARGRQLFADGQPPKLGRLGGKEKEAAETFYSSCAQQPQLCAQQPQPCAQDPEEEPVRTPCALPIQSNPSPRPIRALPDLHLIDTPALSAKTAESRRGETAFVALPGYEDLWTELSAWRVAFPDGPSDHDIAAIVDELNDVPVKAYVGHLVLIQNDPKYRKFRPGAGAPGEPETPGWFKSGARNFARDYSTPNGNGMSKARFDEITEGLG